MERCSYTSDPSSSRNANVMLPNPVCSIRSPRCANCRERSRFAPITRLQRISSRQPPSLRFGDPQRHRLRGPRGRKVQEAHEETRQPVRAVDDVHGPGCGERREMRRAHTRWESLEGGTEQCSIGACDWRSGLGHASQCISALWSGRVAISSTCNRDNGSGESRQLAAGRATSRCDLDARRCNLDARRCKVDPCRCGLAARLHRQVAGLHRE